MRVGILVPAIDGAGAEFVAREWAAFLAGQGHEVQVIVTDPSDGDSPPDGVRYVRLGGSGFLGRARALRALGAADGLEAVVSLMPYWNLLAVVAFKLLRSNTRVLISGRTMAAPLLVSGDFAYRAKQRLARMTYRRADAFIAISTPVAAEAIAMYRLDSAKVSVIPNPAVAKVSATRTTVARPYGERSAGPRPLVVPARLVWQKRPRLALEVAAELGRRHGEAPVVHFFGRGPLEAEIVQEAAAKGIEVRMRGFVPDWFDQCPDGAVVLLPSALEGFGNVLVEAAASGFPSVVSSRALGAVDAVVDGVTGQLAVTDGPSELADCVERAWDMEVAAPQEWLERFSPVRSGRSLEVSIERTLG